MTMTVQVLAWKYIHQDGAMTKKSGGVSKVSRSIRVAAFRALLEKSKDVPQELRWHQQGAFGNLSRHLTQPRVQIHGLMLADGQGDRKGKIIYFALV